MKIQLSILQLVLIMIAQLVSMCKYLWFNSLWRRHNRFKTFVGAGACIIPEIKIGSNVIIGAGSTVLRNIKNSEIFIEKKS